MNKPPKRASQGGHLPAHLARPRDGWSGYRRAVAACGFSSRAWHSLVLGTGEIDVKANVTADKFSASAKEKIEKAGGSVNEA